MGQAMEAVFLPVLPSFRDFGPALAKGATADADKAGKGIGSTLGKSIVTGVAAAGAGLAATGFALYKVGEVFDDVSDTIRVGTGATGAALDGLVGVAKNVGTKVPADFDKIGTVVADLNTRLGLSGTTLETVASQYLEAGRILGEDVDVTKTSAAFSAFKIEGDDVVGAMDHLFQVSQATGVGMNDLAESAARNAPAMQTLGFSFEETTAMVGSFDKAGLNSSAIMASMSKGMVNLAKDGEEPAEAFKRVQGEISGFIASGDKASALDLAAKVFGTKGAPQFIAALESGALNLDDMSKAAGQTGDTILGAGAETMDFAEQWMLFKNNVLVWLEPMGARVFGALGTLMGEVTSGVTAFGAAWSANNGDITSSGIPGMFERLGFFARQAFDYFQANVLPSLQQFGSYLAVSVLPALQQFGSYLLSSIVPALVQTGQWVRDNAELLKNIATVIGIVLIPALVRWGVASTIEGAKAAAAWVASQTAAIRAGVVYVAQSALIVGRWIAMGAAAAASGITTAAVWTGSIIAQAVSGAVAFGLQVARVVAGWVLMGVQSLLQAARMAAAWLIAMGPIGWVTAAVIAIVALVIANWDKISAFTARIWGAIVSWVTGAWENIKAGVGAAITWVVGWVSSRMELLKLGWTVIWTAIRNFVSAVWDGVKSAVFNAAMWVATTILNILEGIKSTWSNAWNWVKTTVTNIWEGMKSAIRGAFDWVRSIIAAGLENLKNNWSNIWNLVKGIVTGVWDGIKTAVNSAFEWVRSIVSNGLENLKNNWSNAWNLVKNTVSNIWEGIKSTVWNAWNNIKGTLDTLIGFVRDKISAAFQKAKDGVGTAWDAIKAKVKDPIRAVVGFINEGLIGKFNGILTKVGLPEIPTLKLPQGFANGGRIPGYSPTSTADNIPIMATANEFMVRQQSAMRLERRHPGALDYINKYGKIPGIDGYAKGGFIWPVGGQYPITQYPSGGHRAYDIGTPTGTPVKAVADGRVSHAGPGYSAPGVWGGTEVHVDHGGGVGSLFAHLSALLVRVGDMVRQGQDVARSGNTGISSGPHLHFGGLQGGMNMVSPDPWLNGAIPKGSFGGVGGGGGEPPKPSNPLDGVIDTIMNKLKETFPGAGMFVDVAGALAKTGVGQVVKMVEDIKNGLKNVANNVFMKVKDFFGVGAATVAPHQEHTLLRDQGGLLPPGLSTVLNATGGNEYVLNRRQWGVLEGLVAARATNTGTGGMEVNFNGPVLGDPADIWREFKTETQRASTLNDLRRVSAG